MIFSRKPQLRVTAGVSIALVVGLAAYLWAIQQTGNFAEVVDGEVYRSNQPTGARLEEYQAAYGVQTVLNLRGASPGASWYDEEHTAAARLGLRMIDFSMSAQRELSPDQIKELLALLRKAPKPLLIHCRAGADRTGLASAIYLALISNRDEEDAESQLSLRFGHFAVPWLSQAWPMDRTWEMIEDLYKLD